ncbi:MAG: carbonic anhydrase family protein, partial [Microcoleaceae cyanobacterium]
FLGNLFQTYLSRFSVHLLSCLCQDSHINHVSPNLYTVNLFRLKLIPDPGKEKVKGITINASAIPPSEQDFYHYEGSLTTPPCSEDVQWYVLKKPIEASQEQIRQFQSIYKNNARPVQPLNGRSLR